MATTPESPRLGELISLLDRAVEHHDMTGCCGSVKTALEQVVASGQDFLEEELLAPDPTKYARRLVHRDPQGRYSVVAMVWGHGQGTKLHDHAGKWCVECVYRGRIRVVSFDLKEQEGDLMRFTPEREIFAGVGEAGALIPPFEYHTIENARDEPTVTLHVYGGELDWCHVFEPVGDAYRMVRKELVYTA